MADPLSVAAGIVGLITAAAQISQILSNVISKARHAPEECRQVRGEIDDIRNVLGQLQLFVTGANRASRTRTSLIMVDQVVATLAACVTTFSDLDVFAESLQSENDLGILDRLRWISKDKDLKSIRGRLQTHKSSLTLMLTILTCQKQDDAEDKVDRLCHLIQQTLEQNTILAQRLAAFETSQPSTIVVTTRRNWTVAASEVEDCSGNVQASEIQPDSKCNVRGFAFEELLMNSRAYRNAAYNNSDVFSVVSSAGRTATWSMLSGLSLSEMSNIAILAIPIYATDINNEEAYDFKPAHVDPVSAASRPQSPSSTSPDGKKQFFRRWWSGIVRHGPPSPKSEEAEPSAHPGIFGMALSDSVHHTKFAIGLTNEFGKILIYGYVPTIVASAGRYLKEKGTDVQDIFAQNGNPARMMHLQKAFDKGVSTERFDWTGFTLHDVAGVLLRYLKALPEPVIPYADYESFTTPLRPYMDNITAIPQEDHQNVIKELQRYILELPPPNRHLLLYLLDILAVYAYYSDINIMTTTRLVSVFQPSLLAMPPSQMDAENHYYASQAMVFMIEYQDSFSWGWESDHEHL